MPKAELKGANSMIKELLLYASKTSRDVEAALYLEAQIEMTESKRRCPVSPTKAQFKAMGRTPPRNLRPGTLRASGYVARPQRDGKKISVTMGYGGAAEAYAVVQHERLDYRHTTGQAKYLESVLNESRPYMLQRMAAHLQIPPGKP